MELVKVPSKRVSVLIGPNGETKKLLEGKLGIKLTIHPEGDIEFEGEPLQEFIAREVVKAIGRGFDANTALKLTHEDYALKVINLREFCSTEREIMRKKARIIGEEGKAKNMIEKDADCHLSIYGNTVSIIAPFDTIEVAVNAIFKIMEGQPHSGVYTYLEKAKKRMKEQNLKEALGVKF